MTKAAPEFDKYKELHEAYASPGHLMYKKMRMVTDTIGGGRALLDFGCGEGEFLSRMAGKFDRLAGIDATDEAVRTTNKRLGDKADIYKYDGGMPDIPGGFDWVACLDVLEHLPNPSAVLAELYALMAPGGRMVVTVPNWYDIINAKILGRNKFHLQTHTPWGWMAILKDAGFTVESCRAVSFPVIKSDFLARRLYFLGMCIMIRAKKP